MTPTTAEELAEFERLVRIETKLDLVITRDADHETRIRRLERALWIAVGTAVVSAAGSAASVLAPLIGGS